ncbi:hypothetical protein Tco_0765803, partial [Tanacetum coccineum]
MHQYSPVIYPHPQLPPPCFVMSELPDYAIVIYHRMFDFLAFRFLSPPSFCLLLSILGAIPDYMSWRHPSSVIIDPKPTTSSYSQGDVQRLSASVVKLRDILEGVLILFSLSRVWKIRTRDPILKYLGGNVMGIHDFLCLPEW